MPQNCIPLPLPILMAVVWIISVLMCIKYRNDMNTVYPAWRYILPLCFGVILNGGVTLILFVKYYFPWIEVIP